MFTASPSAEDDEARLPTCAEQLHDLAQSLPRHIEHTVLPQVAEEVAYSAADLSSQVDGARQRLLQSAVLRRSAVLAPMLKQQLVHDAARLQRRRAQLVQELQRYVKSRPASAVGVSQKGSTTAGVQGSTFSELHLVQHALQREMRGEEKFTSLVQAPLCPSTATLTSFLAAAVTQKGLHRRVLAQVGSSEPAQGVQKASGKSATLAASTGAATASSSSSPSPQLDGAAEGVDAIEEALRLLLHHIRLQGRTLDSSTVGGGSNMRSSHRSGGASPRPGPLAGAASASGVTSGDDSTRVNVRGEKREGMGICDVDGDSDVDVDDEEEQTLRMAAAEEDVSVYDPSNASPSPIQQRQQPSQEHRDPRNASSSASSGPWVRVPGIVSLRQFCADLPWVADLAEQRYTEARERKKHSSSGGSGGSEGGEGGYFSRHVQPDEEEKKAASRGQLRRQKAASFISSLGPFGCFFSPALAAGAAEDGGDDDEGTSATSSPASSPNGRAESMVARAMRHTAAAAASSGSPFLSGDQSAHVNVPLSNGDGVLFGSDAPTDERTALARAVVQCLSLAVDDAWRDVEETVLTPFCAASAHSRSALLKDINKNSEDGTEKETTEEEEEEAVSAFLEVVRVRYAVELAAQVVAARQAVDLLLDSEDSVVFDGARLLTLSLHTMERAGKAEQSDAMTHERATTSSPSSSVLPCTVLTVPGLEEVFYVVAYCTGAAMLREAAAATAGTYLEPGGQPFVIDVDAQEETAGGDWADAPRAMDFANEEDTAAQHQASLQAWAAGFEQRFLAPLSSFSAFTGDGAVGASHSLSHLFRLWLYLWKYVLSVPLPSTAEGHGCAPQASQAHATHRPPHGGTPAQLLVAPRTARRWIEKVTIASRLRGCAEASVIGATVMPESPQWCLPSFWTPSEAERVVQRTTAQARQALLRAAGMDTSA
ncbi:hypothetical protein ABB37_05716 [Leptomonas pyrrhocoris]|uniref:Uncharacterized protein n=1 Tax=Leptomonas pyrrhocoris TaxID=157538 RepID=A0A0N0DUP6_LEPPY|nr:hypothetical protein ABB37_05716 [Leptomonas pyrrhocoris]KPA79234.1 hypothetical protein ABB37_05716 [Leptomonas pyrrhocoris]|eukprot:XP_015657673.1 hypothetical protein ABB37_05716 [Leptomonas pyrrhocoris]